MPPTYSTQKNAYTCLLIVPLASTIFITLVSTNHFVFLPHEVDETIFHVIRINTSTVDFEVRVVFCLTYRYINGI